MINIDFRKNLKFILWAIVFFCMIWGSNLPGFSFAGLMWFPIRIIVLLWFVGYILLSGKAFTFDKVDILFLVLNLYGAFTIIWSGDTKKSITALSIYITSYLCFLMIKKTTNSRYDVNIKAKAFLFNILIICVVGLYESFTGEYLIPSYDYYFSASFKNIFGLYKPSAGLYNINNLAVLLALSVPIFLYAFDQKKTPVIFRVLLLGTCFFVTLLTGSRTGYLCVILSLAIYYFKVLRNRNFSSSKKTAILCGIFVVIVLIALSFSTYIAPVLLNQKIVNESRWGIWASFFNIAKKYMFMGCGIGVSAAENIEFFGSTMPPHNYLLEILVEFGVVGLLCMIFGLKNIFFKSRALKNGNSSRIYSDIFLLLFLFCSICPSSMIGYYIIWGLFAWFDKLNYLTEIGENE